MSQQTEDQGMNLPNPAEWPRPTPKLPSAAARWTQYMEKKARKASKRRPTSWGRRLHGPVARLMANPYKMAQTEMNMMWDYFSLWQNTSMKMMGMPGPHPLRPAKGDKRFKDEDWEQHFLFDFVKQSYLITAATSTTPWRYRRPGRTTPERSTSSPVSTSMRCRRPTSR
jgi:polyhydroxyalkanoate synthase